MPGRRIKITLLGLGLCAAVTTVSAGDPGLLPWPNGASVEPVGHWYSRLPAPIEFRRGGRNPAPVEFTHGGANPAPVEFLRGGSESDGRVDFRR